MPKRPVTAYHLVVVLAVCITLCGASLAVALRVNRNTEEKFCASVASTVQGYRDVPPTTPAGRNQQGQAERLFARLHCPASGILRQYTPPSGK